MADKKTKTTKKHDRAPPKPGKKSRSGAKKTTPTTKKRAASAKKKETKKPADEPSKSFPVVAIGASAGGLEALEAFFRAVPSEPGVAFVVVVHLDPKRKSLLPELLQRTTALPVTQIRDGEPIKPDHVYVLPPNMELSFLDDAFVLTARQPRHPHGLTIDTCFRSLAEKKGSLAVAIVLSGTGSDGTLGIRAIKGETGMVMVQDESAKYDGMPTSVVDTGLADYILPPEKMPEALMLYLERSTRVLTNEPPPDGKEKERKLQRVLALIRARTGHDFSEYKTTTLSRRIDRRMSIHHIDDLDRYFQYLTSNHGEAETLFRELLIGVTSFFRDPEAFDHLQRDHIKKLLSRKSHRQQLRVWVPACSTGEEAYSIAILVHECLRELEVQMVVQIFGTDIDEHAIETARAGRYPPSIEADLTEERLHRYFTMEDDGSYRISKTIREMLIFAPQNITKDPSFSKLDLISCRNLLIYLSTNLQNRLLSLFHYSLLPGGLLLLGSSETIGRTTELFHGVDRKWRIFRRRPVARASNPVMKLPSIPLEWHSVDENVAPVPRQDDLETSRLLRAVLRESETPPFAVIDGSMNIVFVHGSTGRYLEPPEGEPSSNILDMSRPGLRPALTTCVRTVLRKRQETQQQGITFASNGDEITVDLTVKPILEPRSLGELSIVFFKRREPKQGQVAEISTDADQRSAEVVKDLERQLVETKENLQTTIEELETSNEELKSTNEELQSTNEELQSTNEELETSKEELQSLNEESGTVNAELQARLDDLVRANDDLKNLIVSTGIATIFLDTDLCIRRFTPSASELVPLTPTDEGRPLRHFAFNLVDVDIEGLANEMLDDLVIREQEVTTKDGRQFLLKVRPYKTANNAIDGAVVTFEDRTEIQKAQQALMAEVGETAERLAASEAAHAKTSKELAAEKKKSTKGRSSLAHKTRRAP